MISDRQFSRSCRGDFSGRHRVVHQVQVGFRGFFLIAVVFAEIEYASYALLFQIEKTFLVRLAGAVELITDFIAVFSAVHSNLDGVRGELGSCSGNAVA